MLSLGQESSVICFIYSTWHVTSCNSRNNHLFICTTFKYRHLKPVIMILNKRFLISLIVCIINISLSASFPYHFEILLWTNNSVASTHYHVVQLQYTMIHTYNILLLYIVCNHILHYLEREFLYILQKNLSFRNYENLRI